MHAIVKELALQGDDLVIVRVEPPAGSYLSKIDEAWERGVHGFGPYVTSALSGNMRDYANNVFFFGELAGEIVARMGYITPRDTNDIATLGFVNTKPEHRRKGISSALLRVALEDFAKRGGIAMHLATLNPSACRLYRKHGFQTLGKTGIMRYVKGGIPKFESRYYAYNGQSAVRRVHWGDFPRIESLYSIVDHPWLIRDYTRGVWREDRKNAYEDEILHIMELEEKNKGAAVLLENGAGRAVGCASLVVNQALTGQKSADFDLFVTAEYFSDIPVLLSGLEVRAEELGVEQIEIWLHPGDAEKLDAVKSAGYKKRGERKETRLSASTEIPLELYGVSCCLRTPHE